MKAWQFFEVAQAADLGLTTAKPLDSGDASANVANFFNRIAEILLVVALPLAAFGLLYFIAAGLIQGGGKPEAWASAKKNFMYIVIGIFIIVFAVVLVRLVTNLFKL